VSASRPPASPVPAEVATELERVVERWRQLPLDRALWYAGRVRALVQSLADGVAVASGVPASVVPDLGPATLMDQLTVLVYDVSTAGVPAHSPATEPAAALSLTLAQDLAGLRRGLR
jgi:hypothetical protein